MNKAGAKSIEKVICCLIDQKEKMHLLLNFSDKSSDDNDLFSTDEGNDYRVKTFGTSRFTQKMYTCGTDYQWMLSPTFSLNMGAKLNFSRMRINLNYSINEDGTWKKDTENIDNYKYNEQIIAGYGNVKWQIGKFDFMAGVRYENTLKDTKSEFFSDRTEKRTYSDFFR